jgi:secreted trypsin-like serine protease
MLTRLGRHACKHALDSQVTVLTRRSHRLSARLVKVFSLLALIAQTNAVIAGDLVGEPVDGIVDLNTRIIGGNKSADGEWPSVVALVRSQSGISLFQRQFCAGTAIAPRWVLTAAHCMFDITVAPARQNEPATLRVVAGVTDLTTSEPFTETVVVNVFVHPDYDPSSSSSPNDIALLELATDVQVPGIALSGGEVAELVNVLAHIVGWGSISADTENPDFLPEQRDAAVPIVDHDVCNASEAYSGILVDSQMCAGFPSGGVDTCAGDSGGPLIVEFQSGRAQVGLVSFGAGCAQPGAAGIYTDIAKFDDWIKSFVDIDISSRGVVKKRESGSGAGLSLLLLASLLWLRRANK